jgi:uncharacterized protein YlxW (UPF0749 family)
LKKLSSQITVAIVCCILGFVLTYQFKQINKNQKSTTTTENTADITLEIQQLRKQKQDMQTKMDDLDKKIKNYETSAASQSTSNNQLLKDLENSRIINGMVDVKGPGVVIEITPQSNILGNNLTESTITPFNLSGLINNLIASGAEAISINDIRITSRTGIDMSGSFIKINNTKIPQDKKITIKVIGDKQKIIYSMDFNYILSVFEHCTTTKSTSDEVVIHKYEGDFKYIYAKPVENK